MGGGAATGAARQPVGPGIGRPDPRVQRRAQAARRPAHDLPRGRRWRGHGGAADKVDAALIDHVNNLKLQYLVELSKLGDSCADLETEVSNWLSRARRGLRRADDPVRADAALRLPRPGAPRQARRHRAVPRARPLLRRLPDRRGAARGAPAPRHRGLADPHRPGLPAPDAHLPARRLPAGLRRQVPRVQRRLPRRRRLHRHPLRGAAHHDPAPARAPGVRHRLHAHPPRADHDAARRLRARPRHPHRPPRDAAARARRRGRAPRASPSSASSAPPPRPPASRPTTPRSTRSPTTAPRCASRTSRSSSSTAARCWRTSTSPTSSPPRATAASASSTRSARGWPTTRSCSRCSRTRASRTSSRATRPT